MDEFEKQARELVGKMTLEEKASQLRYDAPAVPRLNIPRYHWWNEALHGLARAGTATMFPQSIGLAAMFDPEEMQRIGDIISTEARAKYNAASADLRETYLPAFEACVKEGKAEGVMGAYNRTNGDPCCAHPYLMQEILRKQWRFDGYYVSDCAAIRDFHENHMITRNAMESAALALKRGCDVNCGTTYLNLMQAYRAGLIKEEEITEACVHAMRTRFRLGLFSGDCEYDHIPISVIGCRKHRKEAVKAAGKSVVLLKNDGLLPLDKNIKKLAVIGPNADSRFSLTGNYHGTAPRYVTVLEGIEMSLPDTEIFYSQGCDIVKDRVEKLALADDRISEAVTAAKEAGTVVICTGLDERYEGEQKDSDNPELKGINGDADKSELSLPASQIRMLHKVIETGADIIIVNMTGSATELKWLNETPNVKAILQGWYPGGEGGTAIAGILFGDINPSGRLPVTFYESESELPPFTDYAMENRTYRYMKGRALYPFGYGLSYTRFLYADLQAEQDGQQMVLSVTVENSGKRSGEEVVQIYLKDLDSRFEVRNRRLAAFRRIHLEAGEKKELKFVLPESVFEIVDDNGCRKKDGTHFEISAGGGQPDERTEELTGAKAQKITVTK
jgi:beta-glucosidase